MKPGDVYRNTLKGNALVEILSEPFYVGSHTSLIRVRCIKTKVINVVITRHLCKVFNRVKNVPEKI